MWSGSRVLEMKKKDEGKRMEVEHQKLVRRMIKSADGGTDARRCKICRTSRGGMRC